MLNKHSNSFDCSLTPTTLNLFGWFFFIINKKGFHNATNGVIEQYQNFLAKKSRI